MNKWLPSLLITVFVSLLSGCNPAVLAHPTISSEHTIKLSEVKSAQIQLNSTMKNPAPLNPDLPNDRAVIEKVIGWLNSTHEVNGSTTHAIFSMGPTDFDMQLSTGETIQIEPAIESVSTTLPNGSVEIASHGIQGQVVFRRGKQAVRLASPELCDWINGGWKEDISSTPYIGSTENG